MKAWGLFWIFAVLLIAVFVSSSTIAKAATVYYVHFVDNDLHQNNIINYVRMQNITPWIHHIDYSGRRPRYRVTGMNIRYIYRERYGDDYPEFFSWLDNPDKSRSFYRKTESKRNRYETDFDDSRPDCNWDSRYSANYNRINNCYFD